MDQPVKGISALPRKVLEAQKDNYRRAKTFQMFGQEVPVEIFVTGINGEILWHESYQPRS